MTSRGRLSPQEQPQGMAKPPGALAHNGASPPALNSQGFLDQLKKQFPRLPEHLQAQLENMDHLLQKILQDLQEYHKQAENFLWILDTCSQPPGFQPKKESQEPGPHQRRAEPPTEDTPVLNLPSPSPSTPEGSGNTGSTGSGGTSGGMLFHTAQESARRPCQFLKPICWDPEDFEDTWTRPDVFALAIQEAGRPPQNGEDAGAKTREPLLVTTISSFTRHAFTCGRSGIKVWSLVGQVMEDRFPESHLSIQTPGAYLRTCLLSPNSMTLLVGGNSLAGVTVWDLKAPSLHVREKLPCAGLACQALASNFKDNLAFAGFGNGTVRIWDLRDQNVVRDLPGLQDGAKNLVVKEQQVWTGGLDACLRCWDLRSPREPQEYQFDFQIMSLSPHPWEDFILVGTASGQQWLQPTHGGQKYTVGCKDSTILGLQFSPLGRWWVSVGMDNLISVYSMPTGTKVFQVPETSSIVCCDVSPNNRLIITGSQKEAAVYQLTY